MRLAAPPASCQVYTPADLAEAIARALGDAPDVQWLEPSHGTGAFVKAVSGLGVGKGRITAVDLERASCPADRLATTLRGVDFLRWADTAGKRFDRIIGNPPFVSIKELPPSLQRVAAGVRDLNERPIGRRANVWYAFVLMSLRLLKEGGSLAFVLPSAAEFADYSSLVRATIRDKFGALELFRCKQPLFDSVREGTIVALARKYGAGTGKVHRRLFDDREGVLRALAKDPGRHARPCGIIGRDRVTSTIALRDVADVAIGGVTGDADYFLMSDERRRKLKLPLDAVQPVVSKAKHLRAATLSRKGWSELESAGERIWLFNPRGRALKNEYVRNYLALKPGKGGCKRDGYKTSKRSPWFSTPMPKTPDAYISGMTKHAPWLCINQMRGLNATNTLYVVRFRSRRRKDRYRWALALLSSQARRQIRRIGRHYADGLVKFEPGPLGKIRLPVLPGDADYQPLYEQAIAALLAGDRPTATKIADSVVM